MSSSIIYDVGTVPPDFMFYGNGSGTADQVVTDAHSRSGYNSFQLKGQDGSPVLIYQEFNMPNSSMSLSASLLCTSVPSLNTALGAESVNVAFGLSTVGDPDLFVGMVLCDDGIIYLKYGEKTKALMSYQSSKWYDCEFFFNATDRSVCPWVNGNMVETYYLKGAVPYLNSIVLVGGESGSVNYLDDLDLWWEGGAYDAPSPSEEATLPSGGYYPLMLVGAVALGAAIPGVFLVRLFRSTRTSAKKKLRIEDVLKAVGMVSPIMGIGIGALRGYKAFGSSYSGLLIGMGVFIVALSLTIVFNLIYKWRIVDKQLWPKASPARPSAPTPRGWRCRAPWTAPYR
jgi:hypothetical protein